MATRGSLCGVRQCECDTAGCSFDVARCRDGRLSPLGGAAWARGTRFVPAEAPTPITWTSLAALQAWTPSGKQTHTPRSLLTTRTRRTARLARRWRCCRGRLATGAVKNSRLATVRGVVLHSTASAAWTRVTQVVVAGASRPLPSLGLFLARSHPANAFSLWAPLLPHRPPGASPPLPGGKNTCTDWWATRARKTARLLRQGEAGQCTACLRQCSLSHTPFVRPGEKKLRHLILSCPEWQLHGEREALVRLGGAFWGVGGQFWSLPVVRAGGTRGTCDSSPTHGDMCLVQGNRRGAHALGGRPSGQGPRPASLQR